MKVSCKNRNILSILFSIYNFAAINRINQKISIKYCFACTFCVFYFLFECYAQSSLDAHAHGEAEMNIVFEGQKLLVELESPSFNLVGFEHEPKILEQHELVEKTIELLKDFKNVANISEEASSNTLDIKVSTTMKGVEERPDIHHEDEHQQSEKEIHSEFFATYFLSCTRPENLKSIELELFSTFALMEEVDVQMIFQGRQDFAELNSENPNLNL